MTHYLYLPGFGDKFDRLRHMALTRWASDGIRVTLVPMHWDSRPESWQQKYARVTEALAALPTTDAIVVVGESASGAMALYTLAHTVNTSLRVVTICGYNHGAVDVHPAHRKLHPAFYSFIPLVDACVETFTSEQRQRITTIYSLHDPTVTPNHSAIEGARAITKRTVGHMYSIAHVLLHPATIIDL